MKSMDTMTRNGFRSRAGSRHALIALVCMTAAGCPHSGSGTPSAGKKEKGDAAITDRIGSGRDPRRFPPGHPDVSMLDDGGARADASDAHAGAGEAMDASRGDPSNPVHEGSERDAAVSDSGMQMQPPADQPQVSPDPGVRGPWPVGVRTVMLDLGTGQHIPVDVWYPARIGSDAGETKIDYDFIDWLPPEAKAQLPSGEIPVAVPCNCYRDLPIDSDHGPYPISIAVHHTGAFRAASLSLMSHWASRGFVVLAADHPKLVLADVLADASNGECSGSGISADAKHTRDVPALLNALRQASGQFAFLSGRIDTSRIAISGNGDGADYSAAASGEAGVRLIMQWGAPTAVQKRGDLAAVVFIAGVNDSTYSSIQAQFQATGRALKPTLLVTVSDAGPLSITELCNARSPLGRNGIALSQKYMLCDINFDLVSAIFPCSSSEITQPEADLIFSYATTAALEEFLQGKDEGAAWDGFKGAWGSVQQLR
jgi:predicted dienelactone hydrolase